MSRERPVDRAPRFPISLAAEIRTAAWKTAGMTRNVSTGGVCVEIDRPLAEGERVEVTLFMLEDDIEAEGKTTLALHATVQWAAEADKGYAFGLRFVDSPPEKIAMLDRVLKVLDVVPD